MLDPSDTASPLSLPPDAPLQHDGAYAAFLIHHPAPASCACILCRRCSFDALHTHLAYHTQHTRTQLARAVRGGRSTLPYIPHACLSIDASWADWRRSVARSTWELVRRRGADSERTERRRCEAAIQALVNERRVDVEDEQSAQQLQPFHSFQSAAATALATHSHGTSQPFSPFSQPARPFLDPINKLPLISLPPNEAEETPSFSPFSDTSSPAASSCFVIPTLSVRSSLCLYLQHRAFPAGSSVLLTAITIPDMLTVLRHYHLTPIPIDIDAHTLAPDPATLRRHAQPGTVALLVAHLYGRQMAMERLIGEARVMGLEVWEDMAEGFRGYKPNASVSTESASPYFAPFPLGSPQSDLVLFSFGSIKQLTAFGGGLLVLPSRHQQTAEALLRLHRTLPVASTSGYWQKCVKALLGMAMLNVPLLSGLVMSGARVAGVDHKSLVVALLRGFPSKLMHNLQHQPSLPLLQQLHYRLANASHSHLHTTVRGELFASLLPPQLTIPGFQSPSRHYWLFPLLPPPHLPTDRFLAALNQLGVDAYRGATQLAVVLGGGCVEAEHVMDRLVYLPVHAGVGLRALVRMAAVVQLVVEDEAYEAEPLPLRSAL